MMFFDATDKVLTDGGKKPWLLLVWFVGAWIVNSLVFSHHADQMAPSNVVLLHNLREVCPKGPSATIRWTACDVGALREYPQSSPWLYGLDVLVPIMDLQQSRYWQPISRDGWCLFLYRCAVGVLGWLFGFAFILLATRWAKSVVESEATN